MNIRYLARTGSAVTAGALLLAALGAGALAAPATFTVSTNITNSCVVSGGGPSDLTPTYDPITGSSVGAATTLVTSCSGPAPVVAFTDAGGSGTSFQMTSFASTLFYQISNSTSCSGIAADDPLTVGGQYNLTSGSGIYNICAAVTAGQTGIPAGSYSDTVTYTITP